LVEDRQVGLTSKMLPFVIWLRNVFERNEKIFVRTIVTAVLFTVYAAYSLAFNLPVQRWQLERCRAALINPAVPALTIERVCR
jgi:hypothetical protein